MSFLTIRQMSSRGLFSFSTRKNFIQLFVQSLQIEFEATSCFLLKEHTNLTQKFNTETEHKNLNISV